MFDLGGGTFDVSLLDVGEGVVEVRATSGDGFLGGDDWDERIVNWLVADLRNGYGIDVSKDPAAFQRLREAAETAKVELSSVTETHISLPFIGQSEHGPLHLDAALSRARFEAMSADLLDRCRSPFQQVIRDAGIKVADIDHVLLVGGSTRMPAVIDLVRELTGGKEPRRAVSPDEVVAIGACLQAGVLKGEVKDILLLDVTPLTLGIETKGGIFTKLIERNTLIPTEKSQVFTTVDDNQPSVQIQVYQGEREIAAYNKKLGMFDLTGIELARRGVPQIQVTYGLDRNSILNVSARDLVTGEQQAVTISNGYTLAKDEIERMTADAERHAVEDRRRRDEAEERDRAEALTYATEESLAGNSDLVPGEITTELNSAVANLKKTLDGTSADAVRAAAEEVDLASQKMQMAIFAQTQRWIYEKGTDKGRKEKFIAARAVMADVEVWPRSFAQWTADPQGSADQSWQLICRACGDRWDREPQSLPVDVQKLRGPYASTQETEQAKTAHLRRLP